MIKQHDSCPSYEPTLLDTMPDAQQAVVPLMLTALR